MARRTGESARMYSRNFYKQNREAILVKNKLGIRLTEARRLVRMGMVDDFLIKMRERLIKRGSYPST